MRQQQSQSVVFSIVSSSDGGRRAAFTLVELVVSIGILVLMLTMAGSVFSLTLRSTGQATALTDLSQRLRIFEQTLAEDLGNVRRGASRMVIDAHAVYAYWTKVQKDLDADDDPRVAPLPAGGDPQRISWDPDLGLRRAMPRADVLMFFTARPGSSYLEPGIQSGTQMAIYGHAELGEMQVITALPGWEWRSAPHPFPPYYMNAALPPWMNPSPRSYPMAAQQWHLGRRSVVVTNRDPGTSAVSSITDPLLLTGQADILVSGAGGAGAFDFYGDVVQETSSTPSGWYARSQMDLTPPARLANRLGACFLPNCASFKVEWAVPISRLPDPERAYAGLPTVWVDPYRDPDQFDDDTHQPDWVRLLTDPAGPYQQASLSNYGGNSPERVAFTDFVAAITDSGGQARFFKQAGVHDQPTTHEWTAQVDELTTSYAVPGDPDPFFPDALRITVDLYDDAGRLDRPIRHVMVIPVGT
ncbi:MAG: type II secretion system protein [Phycisphaerales bacterium]|nr:MAG: type II secretion system protein [Phycisphaerales bacterium]